MGRLDETETALRQDLSFLLARASALSVSAANVALARHDLRARSYSVLTVVAEGAKPTQRDLADFLRLDPSQVVAIVDDLERRGLVERAADPADRRAKIIVPTAAGLLAQAAAAKDALAAEHSTHHSLSTVERRRLLALLQGLAFPSEQTTPLR